MLHIIVPCYNPDPGWEKTLVDKFVELQNALPGTAIELSIVNDGSIKGVDAASFNFIKTSIPAVRWISYPENKGKGYALRYGVKDAEGDYFIYTDIDFPYTIQSMVDIYFDLVNGADIVAGIRESEYYNKVPKMRVIISKFVKKLIRNLLNSQITDTQCGLKGFNKRGREIFLETSINRFLFDMQFIMLASQNKTLIMRPQIVYSRPGIIFSHMHYKILFGESLNFIKLILFNKNEN